MPRRSLVAILLVCLLITACSSSHPYDARFEEPDEGPRSLEFAGRTYQRVGFESDNVSLDREYAPEGQTRDGSPWAVLVNLHRIPGEDDLSVFARKFCEKFKSSYPEGRCEILLDSHDWIALRYDFGDEENRRYYLSEWFFVQGGPKLAIGSVKLRLSNRGALEKTPAFDAEIAEHEKTWREALHQLAETEKKAFEAGASPSP